MAVDHKIEELYEFFDIEYDQDPREFRITDLNKAYVKKMASAYTAELKDETRALYNKFCSMIKESLKSFTPNHEYKDMKTLFDEICDSLRSRPGTSIYQSAAQTNHTKP